MLTYSVSAVHRQVTGRTDLTLMSALSWGCWALSVSALVGEAGETQGVRPYSGGPQEGDAQDERDTDVRAIPPEGVLGPLAVKNIQKI